MTSGIQVAFLGISHPHSSARFRSARSLGGVTIKGAWDEDSSTLGAFCEEVGTGVLAEGEILDDPSIAAVFVHSKSASMAALASKVIEAEKAVLVEKPAGANLDDLRRLATLERDLDATVRVGYNFHFAPALARARELLQVEAIGRASLVRGHGGCSGGEHLSDHLNQPADMGGGLWVIGVHVLHLIVDLFGSPQALRASVEKYSGWSTSASREDVASLTLLYPDKMATFDFTVHENCEWFESSEVTVYGERGQMTLGVLPGRLNVLKLAGDKDPGGWDSWREGSFTTPWSGPASSYSELPQVGNSFFFDREVEEFLAASSGRATDGGVTAHTAYDVAAVVAAAFESAARDGARVEVRPLDETDATGRTRE